MAGTVSAVRAVWHWAERACTSRDSSTRELSERVVWRACHWPSSEAASDARGSATLSSARALASTPGLPSARDHSDSERSTWWQACTA